MDATVKLTPLYPPETSSWKVAHDGKSGKKSTDYPKVKLKQDTGAHVITFDIEGSNTITFSNDPIWVVSGTTKPSQKPLPGADNGQIGGWKVMNNGKQLVVIDWNDAPGDLAYQLNFNGHPSLDPVIQNGGGVKPPAPVGKVAEPVIGPSDAIALILGLVIGAAIVGLWFRSRRG